MAIETWFPLAVYVEDLWEASEHRQGLLAGVLELEHSSGERRTYPGMAWTGDIHGVAQIHTLPQFAWVRSQVERHTRLYLQDLGLDLDGVELYFQRSWPIVARGGEAVARHSHPTAHVSAVYTLAVPEVEEEDLDPGSLVFWDQAGQNQICPGLGSEHTQILATWTELNLLQVVYPPVEGRLILFPAKQSHEVTSNQSTDLRVSLSFDILLTARALQMGGAYEFLSPPPQTWQRFQASGPDLDPRSPALSSEWDLC